MVNVLYSVMALVAAVSVVLLLIYCISIKDEDAPSKDYIRLLTAVLVFCIIDSFWGIVASGGMSKQYELFYAASVLFHLGATITSYIWLQYGLKYMNYADNLTTQVLLALPAAAGIVLVIFNFYKPIIFSIDSDGIYYSEKLRLLLFVLQYLYFLIGFILALVKSKSETDIFKKRGFFNIVLISALPVFFGIFQYIHPEAPYSSTGYMLGMIAIFLGNISIEREKKIVDKSDFYRNESKEIYQALESIAKSFVSIHLFDLTRDRQHSVYSNKDIDSLFDPEECAHDQIKKVMQGVCVNEFTDTMVEFVDTYTLSERMKGKNMISCEFIGLNQGWCMSSFIRVESGPDDELKKVIHAVQNIHDIKVREAKYEQALKEAYENKNYIFAEMLKMEAGGVIATDTRDNIFTMNDTAAKLMGFDSSEDAPSDFSVLMKRIKIDDYENTLVKYRNFLNEGGTFSYYFTTTTNEKKTAYVMATAKLVTLRNGTDSIITTYADISKNREMEKKLIILSETDALTGINNRGSGENKTETALADGEVGMFCLIDVNRFKSINDSFGHSAGDKALVCIADTLKNTFRDKDIIMRLGGDEFAVFARGVTSRDTARRVINRFFNTVENIRIPEMKGNEITVSLGAAFSTKLNGRKFDEIYQMADSVMYKCKTMTGNNFAFYEDNPVTDRKD